LNWLILADDLTGAADAAVAFARRGHATEVGWGRAPPHAHIEVLALDLDTRGESAAEAAARHRSFLRQWLAPGQALYKKIDSTLRGQPAAELAAISTELCALGRPGWGLLAPANPAMGRITRDGRVFVQGEPLERSDTWRREHSYPDADLVAIAQSAGLRAIKLPLATIRAGGAGLAEVLRAAQESTHGGGTVVVGDAESDDDLRRVVAATAGFAPGFYIGTAGLANALAASMPVKLRDPISLAPASRGTLVAVGTLAAVSRESARRLAAREGKGLVRVDPRQDSGADRTAFGMDIAGRLIRGETAVTLLDAAEPQDGRIDAGHAEFFCGTLAMALQHMGALIVTGGETAAALLARCKVHGINLLDEIEPGIALGMTQGAVEVPIITKPGAFGDEDSLARCLDKLNQLRPPA
jgi:uncharacterized protein YgbK (DUF1537 family)